MFRQKKGSYSKASKDVPFCALHVDRKPLQQQIDQEEKRKGRENYYQSISK
jgi:hypothetical protein